MALAAFQCGRGPPSAGLASSQNPRSVVKKKGEERREGKKKKHVQSGTRRIPVVQIANVGHGEETSPGVGYSARAPGAIVNPTALKDRQRF
jgi:hypothetical protein